MAMKKLFSLHLLRSVSFPRSYRQTMDKLLPAPLLVLAELISKAVELQK
jgi:hypothetical protein